MIRAVLTQEGRAPTVLLGLDLVNLDRLRDGKPILVNLRQLDPNPGAPPTDLPDINIAIAYDDGDLDAWIHDHARETP